MTQQASRSPQPQPQPQPEPATATQPKSAGGRAFILGGCLIVAATLAAYVPCWNGSFLWDDIAWTANLEPLFRDLSGLWRIWSDPRAMQQYYPLTGTTFWIDHRLWGDWTLPYHLENILLHALSSVLLWRLLRRLEVPGAWLAGAIFALHPVMVESVAWITQRKNVLSMFFFLAALLAYGRFAPFGAGEAPPRKRGAYLLALLFFACALFSKITTFVLPATILLLCWWKRGHIRLRQDVMPVLPFFVLAAGAGGTVWWLEKYHVGAQGPEFAATLQERFLVAGRSLWFYTGKLLWPTELCFVYPEWRIDPASWRPWLAPVTAAAVLAGAWLARQKIGRGVTVALWFYAGALFPVLGFMDTYAARYSRVWDHWVYLPALGIIVLAAALTAKGTGRLRRKALLPGVAVVVLPLLALLTWRECGSYRNAEVLWRTTLEGNPGCWLAHNNLGALVLERGLLDEALAHFEQAVALRSGYAEAWNNLGSALLQKNEPGKALAPLRKALELEPRFADAWINSSIAQLRLREDAAAEAGFKKALEIQPGSARAESGLGLALLHAGKSAVALEHLQKAVELGPSLAEVRNNLGSALLAAGRLDEARQEHETAVRLRPDLAEARYNLGNVLLQQERSAEAREQFDAAVRLQPGYADAHYNLGFLNFREGRLEEALRHYQEAVRWRPGHAPSRSSLGLALLHSGRTREALEEYEEALKLDGRLMSALNNFAWVLATAPEAAIRDGKRAVELATRADAVSGGNNPGVLKTLAAAYAETSRHAEALAVARRAESIARQQGASELVAALGQCIQLFESNRPCRDETIQPIKR